MVFDDFQLVEGVAPNLTTLAETLKNLHGFGGVAPTEYFRPLFLTWIWFNKTFFDNSLVVLHAGVYLAYLATVVAVYLLGLELFNGEKKRTGAALIASLIFAVYPLHVEVVAWISAVPDAAMTLFFLVSLISYIRFRRTGRIYWLATTTVLYLVAILFKETAAVLIVIYPLYDLIFKDRPWRLRNYIFYLILIMEWLVWFFLRLAVVSSNFGIIGIKGAGLWGSFVQIVNILGFYFFKSINPYPLFPSYITMPNPSLFMAALTLVMVVAAWGIHFWKRKKKDLLFLLIYLLPLIPPVLLTFTGTSRIVLAERYLYLPSVGLSLLLGSVYISASAGGHGTRKVICYCAFLALLIFYGVGANRYIPVWKNEMSFWNYVQNIHPESPTPYTKIGQAYLKMGDLDKAIQSLEGAHIRQDDEFGFQICYNNLLIAYTNKGDYKTTEMVIERLKREYPAFIPYYGIGFLNYWRGRETNERRYFITARDNFESSIKKFPADASTYYYLSEIYRDLPAVAAFYSDKAEQLDRLGSFKDKNSPFRGYTIFHKGK